MKPGLIYKSLNEDLEELTKSAKGLQQRAQEIDDNMIRAVEFSNHIDDVMAVYKSIFVEKRKNNAQSSQ